MDLPKCRGVVTGGASGLGEATVRNLHRAGAAVAILDIKEGSGTALARELGERAFYVKTDVTREESVHDAFSSIVDFFGGIEIAVNCAGIAFAEKILSKRGIMSVANFRKVLDLNLVGTVNIICRAVENMAKNRPNEEGERGVIINTASTAAFDGQIGQAAYSASKAGIVGMTLPIARECAEYGIRVNSIAPGVFDTPLLELLSDEQRDALAADVPFPKRLGKPYEFARLVRHIIENPMLNGETIRLDGALRMKAR
ncbi:MAG: SDR family NAD(P)-dependent oxidoreductase [Syntrophales bacterium]|jgi:NAD(P)-dependent dehydrogenase (short-subunit alcohol dehydrogenase family)|nr:SDR family NAD(P)-dependent oxidoreductase [Syntrophales bacterium]MDY0044605.1 SDR family NAD(P)-dependent oxidoreductase [Syntrophales bacterium]